MYPTIHGSSSSTNDSYGLAVPPSSAGSSARGPSSAAQPPPPGPSSSSNGPPPPPSGGGGRDGPHFPVLRVKIADQFRIPPPEAIKMVLPAPGGSQADIDTSLEKEILTGVWEPGRTKSGAAAGPSTKSMASNASGSTSGGGFESVVEQYCGMGYGREEVSMALAVHGLDATQQDKVVEFCRSYSELRSMGFEPDIVVGALVKCPGDVAAATEACLAASE